MLWSILLSRLLLIHLWVKNSYAGGWCALPLIAITIKGVVLSCDWSGNPFVLLVFQWIFKQVGRVFQEGMVEILRRKNHLVGRDSPVDTQRGVVPRNGALAFRAIIIVALVLEYGHVAQHAEAVGKSTRDEELTMVVLCKFYGYVLSECR